jgi:hypothetical protein
MTKAKECPTEYWEACQFSKWLTEHRIVHTHVANENPSKMRAIAEKKMGKRPGVYDYIVVIPLEPNSYANKLIWVELKRKHGGRVSPDQKEWGRLLDSCGEPNYVCKGHEEAIALVSKLLPKEEVEF